MTPEQQEALALEIEAMFVAVTKAYTRTPKGSKSKITRRHLQLLILGAAKGYDVLEFVRAFNKLTPVVEEK